MADEYLTDDPTPDINPMDGDPTPEGFRLVFPEFSKVSDAVIQFYFDIFANLYDQDLLNKFWNYCAYLYAAHRIYLRSLQTETDDEGNITPTNANSTTGVITGYSQHIGDVSDSITYSSPTEDNDLSSTKYGKELKSLLKSLIIGVSSIYSSIQKHLRPSYPYSLKN